MFAAGRPRGRSSAGVALQHPDRSPRWPLLYFALAGFDLLTIGISLSINHRLVNIYRSSVEVNQEWAVGLDRYSLLAQLATEVNAPGNDVFDTHDVPGEARRMSLAQKRFDQALEEARSYFEQRVTDPDMARQLDFVAVDSAMRAMIAEAHLIFSYFEQHEAARAGERMATMDRKFAAVNGALASLGARVRDIQRRHLEDQAQAVESLARSEYVIAALIVLMISGIAIYGQRIARQAAESIRDRERVLKAEEASRAKDEFLSMLSHELRNPLAPIVTALHLMRSKGNGALERERLIIERQVDHLTQLVNDLLDVSRIARGMIELEPRRLRLADVVARAAEMVNPLLVKKQHRLEIDVPRTIEFDADEQRLAQSISNLLGNAAKYTPPGGRVRIAARIVGAEVEIVVQDNGIGMSSELLGQVFDSFVQGARQSDRAEGGLGLGLTIVRSLIELHGGRVSAESAGEGQGSRFTMVLPLVAATSSVAVATAAVPGVARGPVGRHDIRLLIVDDNRDAAELLGESLRDIAETRVVFDGPSALALLATFRPDVALLDIGLPEMDGYDLARRIRAAAPDTRLIAVSGYGREDDRRRSAEAGFVEHFVKPVDIAGLRGAVLAAA